MTHAEASPAPGYGLPEASRDSPSSVLCLHCSTGSARQWQSLATRIGERHRIIAPDLLGYGDRPAWPCHRSLRLEDEVRHLLPLLAGAGGPLDVVAHSFGAAVAVKLALAHPRRVRSLSLYEPVLFGLLRQDAGGTRALAEVLMLSADIRGALTKGDAERAAGRFVDFWSGAGTWEGMPRAPRGGVRARMEKVRADFDALLSDPTSLAELARLDMPVLCLSGGRSPAAVRRIAALLARSLPRVRCVRFEAAGHMGPLTHARAVNASIESFLDRRTPPRLHTPIAARAA